jgi:hypothetical protein
LQRNYLIALVIVSVLSAVFMIPNAAMLALIFTFGLAAPILIVLPNLLIILWAVFPALLFWKIQPTRVPLLCIGAVIVASAAFIPRYLAERDLQRDLQTRRAVAATPIRIPKGIGIEIQRPASHDPDLYVAEGNSGAQFGAQPCFDLCERLLTGGDVAWVRVVLINDAIGNNRQTTRALLVPGETAACRWVNPDIPEGRRCALFAKDHGQRAALTIKLDEDFTRSKTMPFTPYQPVGFRNASINSAVTGDARTLFSATQIFYDRPVGGISLDAGSLSNGIPGGGFQLTRARSASASIQLADAVEKLGISLGVERVLLPKSPGTENNIFIQPPPDAQDAIYAASLVATATPFNNAFSNAFSQVVNDWHERLRWKTSLSKADRAIFCRTRSESRIPVQFWKDQVIKKHAVKCG